MEELLETAAGSILTQADYLRAACALMDGLAVSVQETAGKSSEWMAALRRLLNSRFDPPLQLWWAYTWLESLSGLTSTNGPESLSVAATTLSFSQKLAAALKNLSAINTSGDTAVAAMAPVVALLFKVVSVCGSHAAGDADLGEKSLRKLVKTLKKVVREILSHIFLCQSRDGNALKHFCGMPEAPKLAADKFNDSSSFLKFPVASKNVCYHVERDGLKTGPVADLVSIEVVLLQLVIEIIDWRTRRKPHIEELPLAPYNLDLWAKLKPVAVYAVSVRRSLSFQEMIMDTLLEGPFLTGNLLDAREEMALRQALCAAVFAEPLGSLKDDNMPSSGYCLSRSSLVCLKKLAVARQAASHCRTAGVEVGETNTVSYLQTLCAPPELIMWLNTKIAPYRPPTTAFKDHRVLFNWLVKSFDDTSFLALLDECVEACTKPIGGKGQTLISELDGKPSEQDTFFFVDVDGQKASAPVSDEAASNEFTRAAQCMNGATKAKKKKRQHGGTPLYVRHIRAGSVGTKRFRSEQDVSEEKVVSDFHQRNEQDGSDSHQSSEEDDGYLDEGTRKRAKSLQDRRPNQDDSSGSDV